MFQIAPVLALFLSVVLNSQAQANTLICLDATNAAVREYLHNLGVPEAVFEASEKIKDKEFEAEANYDLSNVSNCTEVLRIEVKAFNLDRECKVIEVTQLSRECG